MNILGWNIGKAKPQQRSNPNDSRPVKWVRDGYNSWRSVYADE